jgi:hypothetical protein
MNHIVAATESTKVLIIVWNCICCHFWQLFFCLFLLGSYCQLIDDKRFERVGIDQKLY